VQAYFPEIVKELKAIADQAREDLGDDLQKQVGRNNRQSGKLSN
jgi:arylsulfatase